MIGKGSRHIMYFVITYLSIRYVMYGHKKMPSSYEHYPLLPVRLASVVYLAGTKMNIIFESAKLNRE